MIPVRDCVVEIGGLPILLRSADPRFLELVERRYSGFVSGSAPQFELDLELSGDAVSDLDVRVHPEQADWIFERGDFHARWNPASRRGRVRQNLNPYALDSVLRILHSLVLAERGGFLLHAASAICDGRAYLFSGISGAGKTTLAQLAPPDITVLTDEISYVRRMDNDYFAFGTPFAGELARPGENSSAPLGALFFLEKGPENGILDLTSSEAMRRLMRNILFFAEDRELMDKVLSTACDFLSRIRARRLTFYPDGRVWDCVRQFEAEPVHV